MITLLRILKIGQHLAKLWATARCPGFYDSRGNTSTTAIITTTSSSRGSSSSRCIVYLSRWYTVDLPLRGESLYQRHVIYCRQIRVWSLRADLS